MNQQRQRCWPLCQVPESLQVQAALQVQALVAPRHQQVQAVPRQQTNHRHPNQPLLLRMRFTNPQKTAISSRSYQMEHTTKQSTCKMQTVHTPPIKVNRCDFALRNPCVMRYIWGHT